MRGRTLTIGALAAALTAGPLVSGASLGGLRALPAQADAVVAVPVKPGAETMLTNEQALRYDAEAYAAEFGVSVDDAYERLLVQQANGPILDEVATLPSFSGAFLTHTPDFSLDVFLVGDSDRSRAQELLSGIRGVEIRIDTSRVLTSSQIGQLVDRVDVEQLGLQDVQSIGYSIAEDSLVVAVPEREQQQVPGPAPSFGLSVSTSDMQGLPLREVPVIVDEQSAYTTEGYSGNRTDLFFSVSLLLWSGAAG